MPVSTGFNDTVFEILGTENTKIDVVELWGAPGTVQRHCF